MPDTLTHILVSIPIGRKFFKAPWRYIFYLGAVAPDALARGLGALFKNVHDYFMPLHTPLGIMVFIILFMTFFEMRYWKNVFTYLSAGIIFHFVLDAMQSHIHGGAYIWFFPFSWRTYKIGLFEPNASVYFLPIVLLIIFILERRMPKGEI